MGFSMGCSILIAQYKGADDAQAQRETIGTFFSLTAVASLLITAASLAYYRQILETMAVPEEAMGDALAYTGILCAGTFFVFGYNAVCSILRGFGDSRRPLYFVALATVVNIVLDCLLVGPAGMGTKGAAYATIVSQGVSFSAGFLYLRKHDRVFACRPAYFAVRADRLKAIMKVGTPAAAQLVVVNLSYLTVTGMLNVYGVDIATAAGIGLKINTFAAMPCWAVGSAVTAMVGQNIGAGKILRVKETVRAGLVYVFLCTLLTVVAVQLFAEQMIRFFDPANPAVVREGVRYLRICCSLNSVAYAAMYVYDSFLLGIGSAAFAMLNAMLDAVVVRLSLSWFLGGVLGYGFWGIYAAQVLSPFLPAVIGAFYFHRGAWWDRGLV